MRARRPSPLKWAIRDGARATTSRPTRNARRARARRLPASLIRFAQGLDRDAERLGVTQLERRRQTREPLRLEMAPHAPAPQAGSLRQQLDVHARPLHVVSDRRRFPPSPPPPPLDGP